MSVRSERTTPWQCSSARLSELQALGDLAGLDRVVRGLDDQPDAGDALLRPVVQRQRQPAALALLDAQEPVGQPSALAFAQLGLDPQGLGEREEARVVRRAHRGGGEHAQLRSLDGAEGRVGAAQHGQSAALQGGDGQRSDLDGAAVGVGERRGEIRGADGVERGRPPGLPERCARDDGAAVVRCARARARSRPRRARAPPRRCARADGPRRARR